MPVSLPFQLFMDDIFIIILLILLNGVFSMAEIALISARKSRLAADAKRGSRGARAALRLAEDPDRFLSTIQIGITLIGILTGLYSGAALAGDVGSVLQDMGLEARTAHNVAQVSIVAVVTYLSIVIGELVPKRIGLALATTAAKVIARPMRLLSLAAMPAVWLLSVSTSLIVRLLGLKDRDNTVTEEEIKSLIHDGTVAGEVRKVEQDIMERALVLGDLRLLSIMTPKGEVTALRPGMDAAEVRRTVAACPHSFYPVYCDDSHGRVCGVVSLGRIVAAMDGRRLVLRDIMTEPEYFPESMKVYDALERMQERGMHFAPVCDEFGDLAGVVSRADILEGLVGRMPRPDVMPGIIEAPDGSGWIVDAGLPLYDVLSRFDLEELYVPAAYSTLAGLILEQLRHVPVAGEALVWNGIDMEVLSMAGARIDKVKLRVPQAEA